MDGTRARTRARTRALNEDAISHGGGTRSRGRKKKRLSEALVDPRASNKTSQDGPASRKARHDDQAIATLTASHVPPQPPRKPDFWRIQDIKLEEKANAEAWLREQVKELRLSKGQGFSLAADSERTLCATLTSRQQPTLPDPDWLVDNDFIGFTPLNDPESADLDVIAVTGLGGHALGSFRSKDGASVWLRDFAPKDVPRARFVTYGYNTAVVDSDNNQGIHELARTLLDGLVDFRRRTGTQQRPLCFVCHSLGGIVLKEALVISSNQQDPEHMELHEMMLGTMGLVLLGVPNLGLRHEQLKTVVNGQPNENFVTDLLVRKDGEPTQFLSRLTRDFARVCKTKRQSWRIFSYYETRQSATLEATEDGRFTATGQPELMVTGNSAERINDQVRDIDHLSSQTDHRGLVRFDHARDIRYLSMIGKIQAIAAQVFEIQTAPARSEGLGNGHSYNVAHTVNGFVPRAELHGQMKSRLHNSVALRGQSPKILIVYGLGGSGKSQLVLSYVNYFRRDYSSVFVIDASTRASTELDYQQIYHKLHGQPPANASEAKNVDGVINAVKGWFDGRDERCLFVFDSADSMDDNRAADFFDLRRYLPASPNLDVIITTRTLPAPGLSRLKPVKVGDLSPEEAKQLFFFCSDTQSPDSDAVKEASDVVEELGYLALAVTLAGAWVAATPHKGIKDYLPDYRRRRSAFLGQRADSNAHQYNNSVSTTWEMSHEAMSKQCPPAAEMLSFLAFLDNTDLFLPLLNSPSEAPAVGSPDSDSVWQLMISPDIPLEDVVDEAFGMLAKYSFVRWSEGSSSYSMHKLVHAWGHDRLPLEARAKYGTAALECLETTSLHLDSDPTLRARLAPHMMANFLTIPGWFDATDDAKGNTLARMGSIAHFLSEAGLYESAKSLRLFEYKKRKELSPAGDPELLRAANNLAFVFTLLGIYGEAMKLYRQALEEMEKVLGREHPDTLMNVNNLAYVLQCQRDDKTAEELHRRALEGREKVLGREHPDTLTSVNNLALVLRDQRDYKTAEELCRRALEGKEKVLGREHPDTLTSVNDLAAVLGDQGDHKTAEELCRRALEGKEKVLGREHPSTLTSVNNLASVLGDQGDYKTAEELFRRDLEGSEKMLGREHPDTLTSVYNLAIVLRDQGDCKTAEELFQRALEGREKVHGREHPSTLRSVWGFAGLMEDLDRTADALLGYERAAKGFNAAFGSEHPQTVECERDLGRLQRKLQQAEKEKAPKD